MCKHFYWRSEHIKGSHLQTLTLTWFISTCRTKILTQFAHDKEVVILHLHFHILNLNPSTWPWPACCLYYINQMSYSYVVLVHCIYSGNLITYKKPRQKFYVFRKYYLESSVIISKGKMTLLGSHPPTFPAFAPLVYLHQIQFGDNVQKPAPTNSIWRWSSEIWWISIYGFYGINFNLEIPIYVTFLILLKSYVTRLHAYYLILTHIYTQLYVEWIVWPPLALVIQLLSLYV